MAKWSKRVLAAVTPLLQPGWLVLDPFAGVARTDAFGDAVTLVCSELERDWATGVVADALRLPYRAGCFDAIATSPTYGNRMADHHEAKDGRTTAGSTAPPGWRRTGCCAPVGC